MNTSGVGGVRGEDQAQRNGQNYEHNTTKLLVVVPRQHKPNSQAPRVLERRPHLAQPRARQRQPPFRARSSRASTTTWPARFSGVEVTTRAAAPVFNDTTASYNAARELLDALGPPLEGRPGVGFPRRPRRRARERLREALGQQLRRARLEGRAFAHKSGARLAYW